MNITHRIFVLSIVVAVTGCVQSKSPPSETTEDNQSNSQSGTSGQVSDAATQKAVAAKDALFARLSSRLTEAIGKDGSAAAIDVCSREAPAIAAEVGKEQGVSIGRTSFRLRSTKNTPPEWASPFVEQRTTEPQFVALPNGDTGALLPIRLKEKCLMCHGPADKIAPDVRSKLSQLYPDDQATGFKEGDLRGWFWVEVPSAMNSSNVEHGDDKEATATSDATEVGHGRGRGFGRGMGRGPDVMAGIREDMTTLHAMFAARDKINRTVKILPKGAEAVTESDDEQIAALLQEHVPAMESRVHENDPLPPMTFHPIFVELIKHADDYTDASAHAMLQPFGTRSFNRRSFGTVVPPIWKIRPKARLLPLPKWACPIMTKQSNESRPFPDTKQSFHVSLALTTRSLLTTL